MEPKIKKTCSTESVILTTPPTRNHCFNRPKHLRNSSDFVPKSNLEYRILTMPDASNQNSNTQ